MLLQKVESKEFEKSEHSSKQLQSIEEDFLNDESKKNSTNTSIYKEAYEKFFSDNCNGEVFNIENYKQQLIRHKINYHSQKFYSNPIFRYLSQTESHTVVIISVSFSYFTFQVTILNKSVFSLSNKYLDCIGSGGMGSVYLYQSKNQQKFAIKSIQYCNNTNFECNQKSEQTQQNLKQAILQCCFNKLFSVFKIGPHFETLFGFDMVIYNQVLQISFQLCTQIQDLREYENLKQSLRIMHYLKIIHGDIKPSNIMYSPHFQKIVFVDFGLSKVIEQDVGQLTFTNFFGSYFYSVKQMKSIFSNKNYNYVDLYYNDVHSLIEAVYKQQNIMMQPKFQPNTCKIKNKDQRFSKQVLAEIKLLFCIFHRNFKQIQRMIIEQKISNVSEQIFQFILQLKLNHSLQKIINILTATFQFQTQSIENIIQFVKKKGFLNYKQKRKQNYFSNRIIQNFSKTEFSINIRMSTYKVNKIFFNQDLSYRSLLRKQQLWKQIVQFCESGQSNNNDNTFWYKYVQYIQNIYTNRNEVQEAFDLAKQILQIKKWDFETQNQNSVFSLVYESKCLSNGNFQIFLKSKQLIQIIFQRYQINLCEFVDMKKQNYFSYLFDPYCEKHTFEQSQFIQQCQENIFCEDLNNQRKKIYQDILNQIKKIDSLTIQGKKKCLLLIKNYCCSVNIKHKINGIGLFLKLLGIVFSHRLKELTVNKIEQFQNCFINYNIQRKSLLMIQVAEMALNLMIQRQDFLKYEESLKIYESLAYNYCFSAKIIQIVLLHQMVYRPFFEKNEKRDIHKIRKSMNFISSFTKLLKNDPNIVKNYFRTLLVILRQIWETSLCNSTIQQTQNRQILQIYVFMINEMMEMFYEVCPNNSLIMNILVLFFREKNILQKIKGTSVRQKITKHIVRLCQFCNQFYNSKSDFTYIFFKSIAYNLLLKWEIISTKQYLAYLLNIQELYPLVNNVTINLIYRNLIILSQPNNPKLQPIQQNLLQYLSSAKDQQIQHLPTLYHLLNRFENKNLFNEVCQLNCQKIMHILFNIALEIQTKHEGIFEFYTYSIQITNTFVSRKQQFQKRVAFIVQNISKILSQDRRDQSQMNYHRKCSNILPILLVVLNVNFVTSRSQQFLIQLIWRVLKYIQSFSTFCVSYYRRRAQFYMCYFISYCLKHVPSLANRLKNNILKQKQIGQRSIRLLQIKTIRKKQYQHSNEEIYAFQQIINRKAQKQLIKAQNKKQLDYQQQKSFITHQYRRIKEKILKYYRNKMERIYFSQI